MLEVGRQTKALCRPGRPAAGTDVIPVPWPHRPQVVRKYMEGKGQLSRFYYQHVIALPPIAPKAVKVRCARRRSHLNRRRSLPLSASGRATKDPLMTTLTPPVQMGAGGCGRVHRLLHRAHQVGHAGRTPRVCSLAQASDRLLARSAVLVPAPQRPDRGSLPLAEQEPGETGGDQVRAFHPRNLCL